MVSDAQYEAATKRGRDMQKHVPQAIAARYDARLHRVIVTLNNRLEVAIVPELSEALHHATPAQLQTVEVTGAGYHIFFPKLEDGIYLPSLLQGIYGTRQWMKKQAAADREKYRRKQRSTLAAIPSHA